MGCGEPEPGGRPDELTLPAPRDGLELIEDAAAALRHAGIGVSDLGLRRPTLDDVFLQLTGAPPSEDGAGSDAPASTERPPPAATPANERQLRLPRLHFPTPAELRSALTDAGVVTGRNLRHFIRQPQLLIFSTIQPIMFVLLFAYVFGGAVKGSLPNGVDYIDFLLPGIFVQSVAFRATQTAVGLSEDLERGVIDRFRSMPMARSAVLIGRTTADLVRNVLIILLMTAVGYLIGFQLPRRVPERACMHRGRQRIRARPQLDLRVRRADRARRGGGAVGGLRGDLPARVRELGVRAGLDHAGLAADGRGGEPGDADRGYRTHLRARRWRAGVARRRRPPGSSACSRSSSRCACGDTGG